MFYLYPVNYSLHSNSDVYEIIKYDIILELISKEAFKEVDISNLAKYTSVIANNVDKVFIELISLFSRTGKKLKGAVDLLEKLHSNMKVEITQISDPLLPVKEFRDIINKLKWYNYEDYITSVIKEKLTEMSKKRVLVVDDLDRIDPDHLFRIISVFSAHIDHETEDNKFGFNKIIFVGDIENIQCMFEHKFGMKNSFNAFISKLYSTFPFLFNPEIELYNAIPSYLAKINIVNNFHKSTNWFELRNKSTIEYYNYIISFIIFTGHLSLREMNKRVHKNLKITRIPKGDFSNIQNEKSDIYVLYKILQHLLMDELSIIDVIDQLINKKLSIEDVIEGDMKENLIVEYSTIPIRILLPMINQNLNHKYMPTDLITSEGKFQVQEFNSDRESYMYRYYSLFEIGANEYNLLKLTKVAFKKIQDLE